MIHSNIFFCESRDCRSGSVQKKNGRKRRGLRFQAISLLAVLAYVCTADVEGE